MEEATQNPIKGAVKELIEKLMQQRDDLALPLFEAQRQRQAAQVLRDGVGGGGGGEAQEAEGGGGADDDEDEGEDEGEGSLIGEDDVVPGPSLVYKTMRECYSVGPLGVVPNSEIDRHIQVLFAGELDTIQERCIGDPVFRLDLFILVLSGVYHCNNVEELSHNVTLALEAYQTFCSVRMYP